MDKDLAVQIAIRCMDRERNNYYDNWYRANLAQGEYRDEKYIKYQQDKMNELDAAIRELEGK